MPANLAAVERDIFIALQAIHRLSNTTRDLGNYELSDDLTAVIAWLALWQERCAGKRPRQLPPTPDRLWSHVLPF